MNILDCEIFEAILRHDNLMILKIRPFSSRHQLYNDRKILHIINHYDVMLMSWNMTAINKYGYNYKHQHISKHSKQDLLYNTLFTCLVDVMEKGPNKPLDNIKVMEKGICSIT